MGADPGEPIILDELTSCPYLPDQTACLPMRLPRELAAADRNAIALDTALAEGDRRSGFYLYRTACPTCRVCQPLRINIDVFRPSRSQRRVLRQGRRHLRHHICQPKADAQRTALFNRHRRLRRLGNDEIDTMEYRDFLVESAFETIELDFLAEDQLVAVAICDRGLTSLSAVYCFFDPDFAALSPGTFAILTQIDLCRQWALKYLYLGFYVAANPHLRYKGNFQPHERLVNGAWTALDGHS